tara:strand:+ start:290 stop:772 length:483 start_codon:yes stop_codon:yes gene_type:complete
MRIEICSTLPYALEDILNGLLLLRTEQAEPRVTYIKRKHTADHIVHEMRYEVHLLLVPFVGKKVVMREDITIGTNRIVVKTYGENYQQRVCPYMVTEARYAQRNDRPETDCTLVVEWAINEKGLGTMIEDQLNNFGRKQQAEIQQREIRYIEKYRSLKSS